MNIDKPHLVKSFISIIESFLRDLKDLFPEEERREGKVVYNTIDSGVFSKNFSYIQGADSEECFYKVEEQYEEECRCEQPEEIEVFSGYEYGVFSKNFSYIQGEDPEECFYKVEEQSEELKQEC